MAQWTPIDHDNYDRMCNSLFGSESYCTMAAGNACTKLGGQLWTLSRLFQQCTQQTTPRPGSTFITSRVGTCRPHANRWPGQGHCYWRKRITLSVDKRNMNMHISRPHDNKRDMSHGIFRRINCRKRCPHIMIGLIGDHSSYVRTF